MFDLNSGGDARCKNDAWRCFIDVDPDRYAPGQSHPGENRIDVGDSLIVWPSIRHVDRTGHAVDAAAQSSERLPIARFHYCPAALSTEAVRPAGQTEQIAGPQIVGVVVNEGEPALQSFAVRQEQLASPLVHTRQTRCSPHALSSCWTRFSPLIMHLRVHLSWIIIVAPPSDIVISLVPGAGVPGNGAAQSA
jgi:hypothetical protein